MMGAQAKETNAAIGWEANLRLGYVRTAERTVLSDNQHCGPLRVQRPLYPEGGVCHTYILHPPGGVVGGDSLGLKLNVGEQAHALVTTPGATKFYRSGGRKACQRQQLEVENGILEWFPQDNIIFSGAQAEIGTEVELHGGARFIGWEIVSLGLPTKKERFLTGRLQSNFSLYRDGRPLFIDRLRLAGKSDLDGPAGLRGFPVTATFLATGVSREMVDELRLLLPGPEKCLLGCTLMGELLVARYLGESTFEARELFQQLWGGLRPQLIGRTACPPRIWST